jgi:hypothetical protein
MRPVPEDAAVSVPSTESDQRDGTGRTDEPEAVREPWRRRGPGERRVAAAIASAVPLAGVVLLGVLMVVLFIRAYEPLSPLDEMEHIDYVHHLLDGDMVELGDTFDPATERAVACRGVDLAYEPPPCGGPYSTADFPNEGYNTAYIHAPLYYGVTAAWVWAGQHVPLPGDDVSLMRSSGILWTVATVVLMWAMLNALQLSRLQRVAGCLLVLASPTVVLALGTVTNDSTALAVGAAVTLAVVRWDQGRAPLWAVVLVCALGVLLKATNIGVLGLAVAYVALRSWQRHRAEASASGPSRNRALVFVAAMIAGTAVTTLAWTFFQASVARLSPLDLPQNAAFIATAFDVSWVFEALSTFVMPLAPAFPQPLRGVVVVSVGHLVSVALVVLFVLGVAARHRREEIGALAGATATALLGLGPLLVVVNFVSSGVNFDIPTRYGLSLVPAVIAVGVSAARTPRQRWALVSFAVLCCLLVLRRLVLA